MRKFVFGKDAYASSFLDPRRRCGRLYFSERFLKHDFRHLS